ncbi:GATA transcription factor 24 [Sesamum angolense]|uniref:GATA transcription factor 24 n=1 Tax=Sesamum angolense TaxID=2727404 RepID=A0AAE1X4T8_9LAMI|nr:GATA transcription factor 24 [Sesamum angolense]
MDAVKGRPFDYANVPIRVHENGGGFDADDISGGGDDTTSSAEEMYAPMPTTVNNQSSVRLPLSRTSELTVSFEGEVYVFPAVTPEKVQAVLLLLGGQETPNSIPSPEFLLQLNDKAVDDVSSRPTDSRRIASLERFREKRKERCFDKKIRYTCRKEVAQRMHRKNGQFASVKGLCKASDDNWVSGNNTPHPEPVTPKEYYRSSSSCSSLEAINVVCIEQLAKPSMLYQQLLRMTHTDLSSPFILEVLQVVETKEIARKLLATNCYRLSIFCYSLRRCQHCGVSETSTPAMRRGPAGPRTLCNACGLMWANKGTLRDLTKGGRHIFDHNEAETLEIKPPAAESDNLYHNRDEERTPEQRPPLVESGNPSVRTQQELMEIAEGVAEDSSIGIDSSGNLGEQETLEELANASGSEFEIPANFGEQVDSRIATEWPGT